MKVRSIATAVPDWVVDNATIEQWCGLAPKFVNDKLGVETRRFLKHDESTTSLAAKACENLFASNPELKRDSVGLVVLVTQNPDYRLPHSGALLQSALGLNSRTASFDINLGCSGYVYGLSVVRALMMQEAIDSALLVTCDPYSKIMRRESREVVGIFGDGAAATWLSKEAGAEIGKGDFGTDGSGAQHLILRAGGAANPEANLDGADRALSGEEGRALHMNGRAVFNFVQTTIPQSIEHCLKSNDLELGDIDLFVMHQASRFMLETLADQLKIPRGKVPIVLKSTGNTVSSSIPMALKPMMDSGELKGKTVLVSGFGVGLSWATNILRF